MKIYQVYGDVSFRGVNAVSERLTFGPMMFTGSPVGARWPKEPPPFKWLDDKPIGDFLYAGGTRIACTERTAGLMREALSAYVELLAFIVDGKRYFLLNPICVTGGLDWTKSKIEWLSKTKISAVDTHAFDIGRVSDALFVLPKMLNSPIYCSEPPPSERPDFLGTVRHHGLTGLEIAEVWNSTGTVKSVGSIERVNSRADLRPPKGNTKPNRPAVVQRTPLLLPGGVFGSAKAVKWVGKSEAFGEPRNGETAVLSPWFDMGAIQISGDDLLIADARLLCDIEPDVVKIGAGKYRVSIQLVRFGRECRVGSVRLANAKAHELIRGKKIAEVEIDTATCGFADADQIMSLTDVEREAYRRATAKAVGSSFTLWGVVTPKMLGGLEVLVTEAGFGDGAYSLRELKDARGRIGVELEFIGPDTVYESDE